jgi:hypothetical protein
VTERVHRCCGINERHAASTGDATHEELFTMLEKLVAAARGSAPVIDAAFAKNTGLPTKPIVRLA